MQMQLEVMQKYPLLSSWNKSTYWTGFITIEGCLMRLALKTPNFPAIRGAILEGDEDYKSVCQPYKNEIERLISSNCSVLTFLDSVVKLISTTRKPEKTGGDGDARITDPLFYSTLLAELDEIGLCNVVFMSKNFQEVHVKHFDPSGRTHVVKYLLSAEYPRAPLKVIAEIPLLPDTYVWPVKIFQANKWFSADLRSYDEFWTEMEDFDRCTRVIDPPNPGRMHSHRRILLDDRVIVHLIFDPKHPRQFPEINISGPDKIVHELDSMVEKECKNWSDERSVIENLETILQVKCCPEILDDGISCDQELVCTVCYAYAFEGEIPDRNCDCGANFHNKCLSDLYANDFMTNIKRCVECPGCGADIRLQR